MNVFTKRITNEEEAAAVQAIIDERDALLEEVGKARLENESLRAQLAAARQWRPVTEPLPDDLQPGAYVVGKRVGRHGIKELAVLDEFGFRGNDGIYLDAQWYIGIPPLPAADGKEGR